MRKVIVAGAVMLILLSSVTCKAADDEGAAKPSEANSFKERASYAIGMDIGKSIENLGSKIDTDMLLKGIKDIIEGNEPMIPEEDAMRLRNEFGQKVQQEQQQEMNEKGAANLEEGMKFLEENKMKEDVETTESGLQYIVLEEGDGPSPKPTDTVSVHYHGTLIDGTVFDSSVERGQPATFPLGRVIPGWTEGLQLMNVGSKYKFFIPADLAYGDRAMGGKIGPNSVLIFEVELLEIKDEGTPE